MLNKALRATESNGWMRPSSKTGKPAEGGNVKSILRFRAPRSPERNQAAKTARENPWAGNPLFHGSLLFPLASDGSSKGPVAAGCGRHGLEGLGAFPGEADQVHQELDDQSQRHKGAGHVRRDRGGIAHHLQNGALVARLEAGLVIGFARGSATDCSCKSSCRGLRPSPDRSGECSLEKFFGMSVPGYKS